MNHADILALVPPLDCLALLNRLEERGVKNAEVARILNLEPSSVSMWKKRMMPKEPHARRLIAIFELYCPNEKIPVLVALNQSHKESARI
jgi:transcriptional regulator